MKWLLIVTTLLAPTFAWAQATHHAAGAQTVPPPAGVVRLEMTPEQISANVNILHEFVKSSGLTQPENVRNATFLFEIFQTALKADADARAKAVAQPPAETPEEKKP